MSKVSPSNTFARMNLKAEVDAVLVKDVEDCFNDGLARRSILRRVRPAAG
jgi:hypothetical protein